MKIHIAIIAFILSSAAHAGINTESIKLGEYTITEWKGLPVLIYKRSADDIELIKNKKYDIDPRKYSSALTNLAKTSGNEIATEIMSMAVLEGLPSRSYKENVLVVLGVSSYFQCFINVGSVEPYFTDPCSGAKYDASGRIMASNKREYYHLFIPPHYYEGEVLNIGRKASGTLEAHDFSPDIMAFPVSNGEKLVEAIMWKKHSIVEELLHDSTVTNYQTETGATPLHAAAARSKPEFINMLVQAGFDVNMPTKEGYTPIQFALLYENEETAKQLLKNGASTNQYCVGTRCAMSLEDYLTSIRPGMSIEEVRIYIGELNQQSSNMSLNKDASR